jgi:hypothetical protein
MPPVGALVEHRRFVQEDLGDVYLYFGVATRLSGLDEDDLARLAVEGVVVFDGIDSGRTLADAVLTWSAAAEPPPWTKES